MTGPSVLAAALADRYIVQRELGTGGMATVYLARDVRHERNVAVKVLRADLASVIGADRFLAEIKTTAHLQHPHILGLIDSGEVAGTVFYVMPFVQGESLRERLRRETQLPIADAIRIATQVASALDYAHRHGVIHRDIKPENILLHDEQALVADFGIALAVTRSNDGKRATETGISLGTPQYMSPEQAMGERTVDARTDIFALGCVLYEMLAGEPPFAGPSAQAIIAKVMTVEPEPVATLRRSVPANVAAATMVALHKIPADRFASASEFSAALANPQYVAPEVAARRAAFGISMFTPRDIGAAAAIVVLAIIAALGWLRTGRGAPAELARFEIPFDATTNANQVHFTPDGSALVWSAGGAYWARRIDSLGVRRLRDAALAQSGIRDISPDGHAVLLSGRGGLAIASLTAGPARTLTSSTGGRGGAAWGSDGFVYFGFGSPDSTRRGIARVPANGGPIDTIAIVGDNRLVDAILALPDKRGLIVSLGYRNGVDSLASFDLGSRKLTMLALGGPEVRYVGAGYLLFANPQYIMAAPFDAKRLEFTQPPAPFIEVNTGIAALASSDNVLVYRARPDPQGDVGVELHPVIGAPRALPYVAEGVRFSGFSVSPDGRRFVATGTPVASSGAAAATQLVSNLYVYELPAGPMQRFPSTDREANGSWIPGGHSLAFVSFHVFRDSLQRDSAETSTLMRRPWDGSAPPDTIMARGGPIGKTALLGSNSWLPGGTRAIVQIGGTQGGGRGGGRGLGAPLALNGRAGDTAAQEAAGRAGGPGPGAGVGDLMLLTLGAPASSLHPIINTEFAETSPAVSPDGRFLAYQSNSSGRPEVYVSPIDGSARRQVSLNGGTMPRWSRTGDELFFRVQGAGAGNDTLYSAHIQRNTDLSVGEIKVVLTGASLAGGYAPLPGDTLFVMRPPAADARRPFIVVMNFAQELKRLFATTR